jgi:hypothetical protein
VFYEKFEDTKGVSGRYRMAVEFTYTGAIIAYHDFESRSWRGVLDTTYVIMFVSNLRQMGVFLTRYSAF